MALNCGAGEDSWEHFGQQRDQINPKGNLSWVFIGRTEAEAPILWPPDAKSWLTIKDPAAEKIEAKGEEDGREWDDMIR